MLVYFQNNAIERLARAESVHYSTQCMATFFAFVPALVTCMLHIHVVCWVWIPFFSFSTTILAM